MSKKITTPTEKQQYWSKQITLWRQSGLSQTEYCSRNKLSIKVFAYWKRKLPSTGNNTSLVEVPIVSDNFSPAPAMEFLLSEGTILRCREDIPAEYLQNIMSALRG